MDTRTREKKEYTAKCEAKYYEWELKWNTLPIHSKLASLKSSDVKKTLTLLADYIGLNDLFIPYSVYRFFSRHPSRRYADEVESAICLHFSSDETTQKTQMVFDEAFTLDAGHIISALKEKLGNKEIKPHGDLYAILSVIKNKTGADYFKVNTSLVVDGTDEDETLITNGNITPRGSNKRD